MSSMGRNLLRIVIPCIMRPSRMRPSELHAMMTMFDGPNLRRREPMPTLPRRCICRTACRYALTCKCVPKTCPTNRRKSIPRSTSARMCHSSFHNALHKLGFPFWLPKELYHQNSFFTICTLLNFCKYTISASSLERFFTIPSAAFHTHDKSIKPTRSAGSFDAFHSLSTYYLPVVISSMVERTRKRLLNASAFDVAYWMICPS